jgi:hypothetical protein
MFLCRVAPSAIAAIASATDPTFRTAKQARATHAWRMARSFREHAQRDCLSNRDDAKRLVVSTVLPHLFVNDNPILQSLQTQ